MNSLVKSAGKGLALWFALIVGTIVSGMIVHPVPHPGVPDGPVPVTVALLVVTFADAVVLSLLASHLMGKRIERIGALFIVSFALDTGLSWIEATAFRDALGLSAAELSAICRGGALRAIIPALTGAFLWRGDGMATGFRPSFTRAATAVALYVALYFAAGYLIAWQSSAGRAFYHGGVHIDTQQLALLQLGRGILWTALAAMIVWRVNASRAAITLMMGAAFAALMAAPLLYPSAIMPWSVRSVHMIELSVSNFLFGCLSAWLLWADRPSSSGRRIFSTVAAT